MPNSRHPIKQVAQSNHKAAAISEDDRHSSSFQPARAKGRHRKFGYIARILMPRQAPAMKVA
jgi:hypothetical protein